MRLWARSALATITPAPTAALDTPYVAVRRSPSLTARDGTSGASSSPRTPPRANSEGLERPPDPAASPCLGRGNAPGLGSQSPGPPTRRRACRVVLVTVGAPLASCWISVAVAANRLARSPAQTGGLIAFLTLVTILTGRVTVDLRPLRGLGQDELEFESGLHRTYVSQIERGQRHVALVNTHRLARALRCLLRPCFRKPDRACGGPNWRMVGGQSGSWRFCG